MFRDKWGFPLPAKRIAEGALRKVAHHQARLNHWTRAKARVLSEIKDAGIEVSESEGGDNYSNALRQPQLLIRNDLKTSLTECHQKILEHTRALKEYTGWHEVLTGNPEQLLTLSADDYLYFFGT